ncbi:Rossmann-like and DUF2520 domain-containing protein [Pedobacter frigoris]|uniref:DUF2520 domain-containing protein n=1 Tax=Pedobacter frigoris TaxID=2571272 RepID=A0A4V5NZJ0_9SPHI|nr:Rossmann-like and DUF2520 domain-containing protein [Pedobacter frigoris]TKC08762.1 DUF2520 domain-containing protein [Pedobacter frigoris]
MDVVCIGSGNVATHMARAFKKSGANLIQIWSRSLDNAVVLANELEAEPVSAFKEINRSADLYVIAVKDDAIAGVAEALKGIEGLVVHTSGATDISILSSFKKFGVLYPLQTFSKNKQIDFANVPLCIESLDKSILEKLRSVASGLTPMVYEVDSEKRRILHLAAVFACNFVNHMYMLSDELVKRHGLEFEMLKPLIMETAVKVQTESPITVQTGPAVRNDEKTLTRHLELLDQMPDLAQIYQTLSKSIKKTHS